MRLNDFILFVVVFASMSAAILEPRLGKIFQPFLLHFMMFLLFLSFLRIDFRALLEASLPSLVRLVSLILVKLILLPVVLYWIARAVVPDYAIPVLLLSGISTGVVAPFMGSLIGADIATVLRMVVVTSVVVPFSLPALVKLLAGAEIAIPLGAMIRMLALVIFVPLVAVLAMRRIIPGVLQRISASQFPVALALFALVNLSVFSKYSAFFFGNPAQIVVSVGLAFVLCSLYYLAGFLLTARLESSQKLAAGVSMAILNNVLVIVFASEFFGPLSPTLAAMYMFPYYTMIVPARLVVERMSLRACERPEAP